jgi:hypothetical protein
VGGDALRERLTVVQGEGHVHKLLRRGEVSIT